MNVTWPGTNRPERCAGCPYKTRCVGTRGPVDSPFVIVGESPGTEELRRGLPFVGKSGQLLEQVLAEHGLSKLGIQPYILNALQCLPLRKEIPQMKACAHACQGRLRDLIAAYPRQVILTLGAAAAWSVLDDFTIAITQKRGAVLPSPLAEKGVVLAVHPAFLMRRGTGFTTWKSDLGRAVALLGGKELCGWQPPSWEVVDRPSRLSEVVELFEHQPEGTLATGDVETDALHWMDGRLLCLGVMFGDNNHVYVIPENLLYNRTALMRRLLESPNLRWNWHNGLFDIKWFRYSMGIQARVDEDTMLLSYSQNENAGYHDLDQVARTWINAPEHKNMLRKYLPSKKTSYRAIPPAELYKYNAIDLSKTHWTHPVLSAAVHADPNASKLYREILIPAVDFVAEMQLYGVGVSEERIRANLDYYRGILDSLEEKIQVYAEKHLGRPVKVGSPLDLKRLLYGKMGLGFMSMSTNEDTLIQVQRKNDHPILDLLLEWRSIAKLRSTYVAALIDHEIVDARGKKKKVAGKIKKDGRIHADFKLHGTQTGRLAGAEPNLLNQPRVPQVRGQYVAKPGYVFVEVDLNQAELRSLALMSGDPTLVEIYTKNEVSIHDVTTAALFAPKKEVMLGPNTPAYERVRRQLMLPPGTPAERVYSEAKMRAKAVNFGIVYGREAFSLSKEFNISIEEAHRWIENWLGQYPNAAEFISWCREAPRKGRALMTVYGRKKRPGLVSREALRDLENEFANFPHQSTASDIMLETAIKVYRPLRERWGANIWNEVYDAIYYEIPADDKAIQESIDYVCSVISEVPVARGLTRVPFLGEAKVGYDWGTMRDWLGSLEKTLGPKDAQKKALDF